MKPPPPILPARGRVTASAKPTATAASTALPPSRSTSSPTRDACSLLRDHHAVSGHDGERRRKAARGSAAGRRARPRGRERARIWSAEADVSTKAIGSTGLALPSSDAPCYPMSMTHSTGEPRGELAHVGWRNRDAAQSWREARSRKVEEDGAAPALGAAGEILVEHEGKVIEASSRHIRSVQSAAGRRTGRL